MLTRFFVCCCMSQNSIDTSLVIPEDIVTHRLRSGEGVRRTDVPVPQDVYLILSTIRELVTGVDVIPSLTKASEPVHVTREKGPKIYPHNMHWDFAKPEHHRARARHAHVTDMITGMLYMGITGKPSCYQKEGDPRTYCLAPESLKRNHIALRPYGENDPFVKWIEEDVAPKLQTRLQRDGIVVPPFTRLKVTNYTESSLDITFV